LILRPRVSALGVIAMVSYRSRRSRIVRREPRCRRETYVTP